MISALFHPAHPHRASEGAEAAQQHVRRTGGDRLGAHQGPRLRAQVHDEVRANIQALRNGCLTGVQSGRETSKLNGFQPEHNIHFKTNFIYWL